MSKFTHEGLIVNHSTNDIGNTTVWVRLAQGVTLSAVRCSSGEIYSVTLSYGDQECLWFGEFTIESNIPGNAQVQIAPWLPLLSPIFAKI